MVSDLKKFLDAKKTDSRLLGDVERHLLVPGGQRLGLLDGAKYPTGDLLVATTRKDDANTRLVELVSTRGEQVLVEIHEVAHLVDGPAPVLCREGEDRESLDPEGQGTVDGVHEGGFSSPVPLGRRRSASAHPSQGSGV